jgi:hypothetical protein
MYITHVTSMAFPLFWTTYAHTVFSHALSFRRWLPSVCAHYFDPAADSFLQSF